VTADGERFVGVKVFSATKPPERARLGDKITEWMSAYPRFRVVDKVVCQSSDASFHCLSVILFYVEE
jgi:hypothetical protein